MIYAEILAGGKGTRMGNTALPKQFLYLGNKPIIIYTIEQFMLNDRIDRIIVVVPSNWINYMNELLNKFFIDRDVIEVVEGGNDRNETIINGCKYIEEKYGLDEKDSIITHDAVRPFISQRIINDNIEALEKFTAIDTVIPSTDTIVESLDSNIINSIPNRANMYQSQTPQSFNIKKLMNLYDLLSSNEKSMLTDACKIFVLKNEKVNLVSGDVYNIKITTQFDLKMANILVLDRDNKR